MDESSFSGLILRVAPKFPLFPLYTLCGRKQPVVILEWILALEQPRVYILSAVSMSIVFFTVLSWIL